MAKTIIVKLTEKPDGLYAVDNTGMEFFFASIPNMNIPVEYVPEPPTISVKDKVKYFIELKEAGFTADEIIELTKEL